MSRDADAAWLETLQQLCGAAAHELKGALNGVSVNLEVVRSRAGREGEASGLAKFAESASRQLEASIAMTEAMLSLARAGREPADVATIARQIGALVGPVVRAKGGTFDLTVDAEVPGISAAPISVVRTALGRALLATAAAGAPAICRVTVNEGKAAVLIEPCGADDLGAETAGLLADHGIAVRTAGHGISIGFTAGSATRNEES
jgi:signal transduction histidine kinase